MSCSTTSAKTETSQHLDVLPHYLVCGPQRENPTDVGNPLISSHTTVRFIVVVLRKVSQKQLAGLSRDFVQTFMFPTDLTDDNFMFHLAP